jgi:hypothetical protein
MPDVTDAFTNFAKAAEKTSASFGQLVKALAKLEAEGRLRAASVAA